MALLHEERESRGGGRACPEGYGSESLEREYLQAYAGKDREIKKV